MATKKQAPAKVKRPTDEAEVSASSTVQPTGRRVKKVESFRERADKASSAKPKKRVVRKTAGTLARPFKRIGRIIARLCRPLGFLLWPFRLRPVRFIGRLIVAIFFLRFIRNSAREVMTVKWPGRRETLRLTFAVFMFAFVFGSLIAVADYGLDKVFRQLLLK
ncbi:MAG: hypothetical protein NVS1B7_7070 [Candidatus Saccharimonadales bacterium]